MPKNCEIISHQGAGLYSIKVVYDDKDHVARIKEIDEFLISPAVTDKETELLDKLSLDLETMTALRIEQNEEIDTLNSLANLTKEHEKQLKKVIEITDLANLAEMTWMFSSKDLNAFYLAIASLDTEKTELLRLGTSDYNVEEAWCMDLSDGQHTSSIIGNRFLYTAGTLIYPYCLAYNPEKKWIAPGMKSLLIQYKTQYNVMANYRKSKASAATFWNVAMEPGFAKWEPDLLAGVITARIVGPKAIDYIERNCGDPIEVEWGGSVSWRVRFDTVNVRRTNINISPETGVFSAIYFAGNAAFSVGDHVLLLASPDGDGGMQGNIVGFYSYPKDAIPYTIEKPTECVESDIEVWKMFVGLAGYTICNFTEPAQPVFKRIGHCSAWNDVDGNIPISGSDTYEPWIAEMTDEAYYPTTSSGCYIIPQMKHGGGVRNISAPAGGWDIYSNPNTSMDIHEEWNANYLLMGDMEILTRETYTRDFTYTITLRTWRAHQVKRDILWICLPTQTHSYQRVEMTDIYSLSYDSDGLGEVVEQDTKVTVRRDYIVDCNGIETYVDDSETIVYGAATDKVNISNEGFNYFYCKSYGQFNTKYRDGSEDIDILPSAIDSIYGQSSRATC